MAKASNPPADYTRRRLNLKGLIILAVVLIVALASFFPIKALTDRATRQSALDQAKASETSGNIDLALRHMERYVAAWPDDLPGLEYQAKLLTMTARSDQQVLAASQANDKVLRLDPDGKDRQETRRALAQLYIRLSDNMRQEAALRKESGEETSELRYLAAEKVARALITNGANDAEAHRLLALALEGGITNGNNKSLDEAIAEYRKAMELDPKDTIAPERLAFLQATAKKDPAAAESTMDALLKGQPESIPVRLARYRFYSRMSNQPKATTEIRAAATLAPKDADVQAAAAQDAIQRRDFDQARQYLNTIAGDENNQLKTRYLRGMLELNEKHPDEAIDEWRRGLMAVGGTDVELTWQLAHALIQLGRLNEARPVISQFQRIGGPNRESMGRFLRALYDQKTGHSRPAIKELNRIADQVPPGLRPEVYLALGRSHEALNEQSEAMLAYQKAATLAPAAAEPRRAISRILAIKSPIDALNSMESALVQDPNDVALLVEVGRLRLRQQVALPENQRNWEGVDNLVNHAVKIDANNFAVQTLQADALAASGRLPAALEMLKKSVDGPGKDKIEIWLTYAGALDRLNRREEALQVLDRAATAVGDHAPLRIARSRILARLARGQAARDALTVDREKVPKSERPELVHALAELCRELGDRDGARNALAEWAKQLPDSAEPGLALIAFSQTYNDDEAARLGLEALRVLGGEQEPYGLAARALTLLRVDQTKPGASETQVATEPAEFKRLDEADQLVAKLINDAPQLAVGPMLQGLIFERRGQEDKAIEAYRRAVRDGSMSPALPRLVELLGRRDRTEEIERLKAKFESRANADGTPSLITSFDQIMASVALKRGDNAAAEKAIEEMVQAQPDSLPLRTSQARLLVTLGRAKDGEATLRQLATRRAIEPYPWVAVVAFRSQHPELGDINKLIDEVRLGYKGPHPELLVARCRWIANDVPGATKLYDAAVAKNGDDLTTLRDAVEFDQANNRLKEAETRLRRALALDPTATWAGRALALILSGRPDKSGWDEAWNLMKPGAPASGSAPEDRLARATVLARSPESDRRKEAVPTLRALANDLPAANSVAIDARTRLAQYFVETGMVADAVRIIGPIADDTDRPNAQALAIATEALARTNDLTGASQTLERLEAIEPKSPRTAASKAWVLQKQGKADQAFATVEAAYNVAEADPRGETVALAFQDLLLRLDNKVGALKLAERIAAKWPKDSYVLARAQFLTTKAGDAIRSCRRALEAGEVRESLRIATQIAIEKRNDSAVLEAVDELGTAALAKAPKDPEVANFVATIRHLQGRYEEEIAMYRVVLENNPSSYLFLNNMAWTLSEGVQRYDEALQRIDDAIRREGQAPQFLDTRGVILERLGKPDRAIADFEQSVKGYPMATTFFHLARAYRQTKKMDDYRRARDMAKKLKLDPETLDPTDKADLTEVMDGN